MAIANDGPQGPHRGRIGNMVYYDLNGQNVGRQIGRITTPPTENQLRNWEVMKLVPAFLKSVLEFINLGFSIEQLGTTSNSYNVAMKLNVTQIVTGDYPNLYIDYSKVILSKGILKPAQNPTAEMEAEAIRFSWDTNPQMPWEESTDQVMMLAYFPEQKKVFYTLFGKDRIAGNDSLPIPDDLLDQPVYTYISFVAANRRKLADSIFIGGLNLTP
ncbi:MAG: hypothetical protein EOO88_39585 [Pedobacter sp.]|nr:MAG: hypothetical protein EOO88_39585 [Pedobacter sp.]